MFSPVVEVQDLASAQPSNLDPRLKDFRNFLYLVWQHLNLPAPTLVQYDIAHYLHHGDKRIIIEAFRGVGKSWITSAFACWSLLMNPQEKILVVSASKQRADDFSTFTKRLINEMPVLQHLIPREGQRDSNIAFEVGPALASHSPSVKSVGITGQITGSRASLIIADDVESANNSATQVQREKLGETIKEFDAVLTPEGRIVYLGTPQTEESIYNKLKERGYRIRVWPARYPKNQKMRDSYGNTLAPIIADKYDSNPTKYQWEPTDPSRFDNKDLIERELSYGKSGFALQFMLDTSLSDADKYPLKTSDLIIMAVDAEKAPVKVVWASSRELIIDGLPNMGFTGDRFHRPMWVSPDWTDYQGTVMSIDPSGRGKDQTGYAVVSQINGQLHAQRVGGLFGGYTEENLRKLATIARDTGCNRIIVESNFGDGMFSQLLKPVLQLIYPCTVEEVRHSQQKEKRIIDTLEPVMNQHRLVFDERIIKEDATEEQKNYSLMYQLTHITRERGALLHDDQLDALAIAVAYWVEAMARSQEDVVEQHREELLKRELERFLDHAIGQSNQGSSWISLTGRG